MQFEPIGIIGIVEAGVGRPRNDGSGGSALYAVPIRLSMTPPHEWTELFVQTWDRPPEWTNMHRPGIARVDDDQVVLDGTTLEEVASVHVKTIKLAVQVANDQYAALLAQQQRATDKEQAADAEHRKYVSDISRRIQFD